MKMYIKPMAMLLLCFCLLAVAVSCGQSKMAVPREVDAAAVSMPYSVSDRPNPLYARTEGDRAIVSLIFETYFGESEIAAFTEKHLPDESYLVTVVVKQGVKFSNSRNVGASDLAYIINLVCDPTYDGTYGDLGKSSLKGLTEYRTKKTPTIEGVQVLDSLTVQLQFEQKEDFEKLLDLPVVSKDEYGSFVFGQGAEDDLLAKYANLIGTGVYAYDDSFEMDGTAVKLKKSRHCQDSAYRHEEVTVFIVEDQDVGLNIKMGQIAAGIVLDEGKARSQAKENDLEIVPMAIGYLLCDKKLPDAAKASEYTAVQILSFLLKRI